MQLTSLKIGCGIGASPGFLGGGFEPITTFNTIGPGVKTWFNGPRVEPITDGYLVSVIADTTKNRTVYKRNVALDTIESVDVAVSATQDDHNDGAVIELDDGHYAAMFVDHNASDYQFYKTTIAGNLSTMALVTNMDTHVGLSGYSYAHLFEMTDLTDDPIVCFTRQQIGGQPRSTIVTESRDGGTNWDPGVVVFENAGERPYIVARKKDEGRLDFLVTHGHPDEVTTNGLFHVYFDSTGFHKTDASNTALGPLAFTDMTEIYNETNNKAWNWDIAYNSSGHPVVAFQVYLTSIGALAYYRAEFNGTTWDVELIAMAGDGLYPSEPMYGGGLVIDPDNTDILYGSIGDGTTHNIHQFQRLGANQWSNTQVTAGTDTHMRPMIAAGKLIFFSGTYNTYTSFDMDLVDIDLPVVENPPIAEVETAAYILDVADSDDVTLSSGSEVDTIANKGRLGGVFTAAGGAAGLPLLYDAAGTNIGHPTLVWNSSVNDTRLSLPANFTAGWGVMVMQYKDGTASVFDNYNGIWADRGNSSSPRVMGDLGAATLYAGGESFETVGINGAAPSATVLPLPLSVLDFDEDDTSGRAFLFDQLGCAASTSANRGWQGYMPYAAFWTPDLKPNSTQRAAIIAGLMSRFGIT